jgi:hypothetical protein
VVTLLDRLDDMESPSDDFEHRRNGDVHCGTYRTVKPALTVGLSAAYRLDIDKPKC